jgi:hypothetical protein
MSRLSLERYTWHDEKERAAGHVTGSRRIRGGLCQIPEVRHSKVRGGFEQSCGALFGATDKAETTIFRNGSDLSVRHRRDRMGQEGAAWSGRPRGARTMAVSQFLS